MLLDKTNPKYLSSELHLSCVDAQRQLKGQHTLKSGQQKHFMWIELSPLDTQN